MDRTTASAGRLERAFVGTGSSVTRDMNRMAASTFTFGDQGGRGINKIERALSGMVVQMAGVDARVAQLSTAMLAFGVGGPVTLGFVAGFAAMTLAMKILARQTEEELQLLYDLQAEADKLRRTPVMDATERLASARTKLAEATAKQRKAQEDMNRMTERSERGSGLFSDEAFNKLLENWRQAGREMDRARLDVETFEKAQSKTINEVATNIRDKLIAAYNELNAVLQRVGQTGIETEAHLRAVFLADAQFRALVKQAFSRDQGARDAWNVGGDVVGGVAGQLGVTLPTEPISFVVNAIGTVIRQFREAAIAARQIAEATKAFADALQDVRDQLAGDTLATRLRQEGDRFDRLREDAKVLRQTEIERFGGRAGTAQAGQTKRIDADYAGTLKEIDRLERARIRQLEEEVAALNKLMQQDLEVRLLRARGFADQADALAFALAQEREYTDAVQAGADALTLAKLAEVQRAEALQFATQKQIEASRTLVQAAEEALGRTKQIAQNLRDFQLELAVGGGSPTTNLAEARRQFEDLAALANAGDRDAAARLPQFARQFLDLSRQYNASGLGYQQDFTFVQDIIDALADKFTDEETVQEQILETLRKQLKAAEDQLAALKLGITVRVNSEPVDIRRPWFDFEIGLAPLVEVSQLGFQGVINRLDTLTAAVNTGNTRVGRALEGAALASRN
jgi:hypothetical protein